MTAVASLVFCTDCGNLLPATTSSKKQIIICDACGASCKDTANRKSIITTSKPTDYPSALRAKHSQVQAVTEEDMNRKAVITQACEKCDNKEATWYTLQQRSADEGTTVFYTCTKCGYSWNTNN